VEVSGTSGTLRCDDFVISRDHSTAEFALLCNPGLADNHCRVVEDARSTVAVHDCNQEAAMFTVFSGLVASGKATAPSAADREAVAFWPRVALQTQAVLDACMASIAAGGAMVPVASPRLPAYRAPA